MGRLKKRRCAYRQCSPSNDVIISQFKFPTDPDRLKVWLKACNREDLLNYDPVKLGQNYQLCEKHFDPRYIGGGAQRKILIASAVPTIFTHSTRENLEHTAVNIGSDKLSTMNSQVLTHTGQIENDHCYTIKTEKQIVDKGKIEFGAKSKLENCVVKISNNYKRPGEKSLPKSLLKTSVEPKNMPLILQKVPSPFLNTKKYDAFPVDQTEVLNSLKGAVGNIGDSPENPIIFKLDIATSMDIFKNATLSKKVVKQTEVQEVNTRSVVTKRKSDPGELNLEKNPTKKLKIGCQSSIQLIKTKNLVPKQKAKFLVADNPQMNTPNQNVTAKVIGVIKCATNKNVTAVTKDSSKVTTLDGQAKKPQTNSKVLGSVLTSTNFHEKVDSASCIIQESLLLNQKRKVEKPISIKNEFKKEDLLHSTVIDLTDKNPTSSKAIQPLEAANLSAKRYKCLVPNCSGTKFFPVPSIPKAVFIWQICLFKTDKKRPFNPFSVEQGMVLCDRHFITEDFEKIPANGKVGVLKEHAVPSLYPVCSGCIIPGCVNKHRNTSNMYSIPVWRKCTLWLEYLPHLKHYNHFKLLTYRVCEEHFEEVSESNMFNLVLSRNLPTLETLENLRANKLAVNPENLCAFLLCGRLKQDSAFIPFPEDYVEAITWLALSFRDLILMQDKKSVQKFLTTSPGLCPEHHVYISHYLKPNKKKQLDGGISNVIGQLPLLATPLAPQTTLKKVQPVTTSTLNLLYYLPWREYCAFSNCSTHIKYDTRVRKFKFPTDSQLCNEWKEAAGIHANIDTDLSTHFVCGKHFTPGQFNSNGKLKMESVPQAHWLYKDENANGTNLLWVRKLKRTRVSSTPKNKSDPNVTKPQKSQIPDPARDIQQEDSKLVDATKPQKKPKTPYLSLVKPKCCVKSCKVDATNGTLLNFPPSTQLSQSELFVKAILNKPSPSFREIQMFHFRHICTRHFRPEDLVDGTTYKANAVPTLFLYHETDTGISDQDTTVMWDKIEENNLSKKKYHPRQMELYETSIDFPSVNSRLKFGKDCRKLGVNRYPFDIKQPFEYACSSIDPGHELQLDAAFIIDDDDDSERNAITLFCNTIKSNDQLAKRLINQLARAHI